jgi:heat shock protein HslJ
MNQRRSVAVILGAALLAGALPGLASAQDEVAAEPYPAEGIAWQLDSYAADGVAVDVPAEVTVTLYLSDGDVVGNAGCNSYFGSYIIDATSLSFPTPLASTLMLCEGPGQDIETTYLATLSTVAGWTIDEVGALRLSDAEGTEILVYSEPPIDITATDVAALAQELASLQAQIDTAESEIVALTEAAESANIDKLRERTKANEDAIAELQTTVGKLRNRIKANEDAIAELQTTVGKLRNRIKALENSDADQEQRIEALEGLVPGAVDRS